MINFFKNNYFALLIFIFLLYSFFNNNSKINKTVISICLFLLYRWISNSKKCTISYLECKIRGVKKENGFIYQLLNPIFELNKHKFKNYIILFVVIVLLFNMYKKIKYI